MHIKQITISNFRSFKQQPEIDAFSAGTNSVIGRNGSGKSNLFDAVQFCLLAPRFANLRQDERQALLHEGSGSAAVNAFVEIVFDNSDHRFTIDQSDEVVLRRTIGLHKDEFFLQRKHRQKQEILSLLEGAGFSKSNPYFIVQQGKVQDLCTMSDAERLKLLQQVAGTVVYDEKKSESIRKMQENADSRTKITEMLQDMNAKLAELQSEKDELAAYTAADRQRRAVEYSLYDQEWHKARTVLDTLEHERAAHVETVSQLHEAAKETHVQIRQHEAKLKATLHARERNKTALDSLKEDKKAATQTFTQLQVQCRELQDSFQQQQEQYQQDQKELAAVQQEIAQAQEKMSRTVQPAYEQAAKQLQDLQDRRNAAVKQQEALYAKQGRGQQFATREERDAYLQGNLDELEAAKTEKNQELQQLQDRLAHLRRTVEQEEKDVTVLQATLTQKSAQLQSFAKDMEAKKTERIQRHDARKEEWRTSQELQDKAREAREEYQRAAADFRKAMPRATAAGLEALQSIVERDDRLVQGTHYFGMLLQNMTLKHAKYQTAVEVAAQNQLFHVIVDTDATASLLMTQLERGKLGRVTFLPLNRLRVEDNITYPEESSNDVRPLLDLCIDYDPAVERAMRHVFGKKLVARSHELAAEWSSKLSMDAITLDGDLSTRKGALTGGYVDASKSRLKAHDLLQQTKTALQSAEGDYQQARARAQQADQATTVLMQELQRLQAKHTELGHQVASHETDLERLQTRLKNHEQQKDQVEQTGLGAVEKAVAELDGDMQRLRQEMATELTKTLSDEERELLQQLKDTQAELVAEIETQSETVAAAGMERQKLQSLLDDNLLKRQRELSEGTSVNEDDDDDEEEDTSTQTSRRRGRRGAAASRSRSRRRKSRVSSAAAQAQRQEQLEECQRRLQEQTRIKQDVEQRVDQARGQEEKFRSELIAGKNELEQFKTQDAKNIKALEDAQDKSERLLNKRTLCISKRETYIRKIQELGSLPPPSELEKVSGKSISELMRLLESINKKLKKYSHVNKKAYDSYVNFSEQRDALLKRKEELDRGAEKVKELVESLDRQKDEAINRTFRGVRSHFKDVFKELVPNGGGELIMRTAIDDGDGDTDDEESSDDEDEADEGSSSKKKKGIDAANPDVSLYRGIGIKVRFSEVGENYMMSQLSGGQKALVALALIFAIQRCDPAPFYLFDELDQALDSSYRASVANLIKRQARSTDNPTQFIVSTFRPELVQVADRCYGISHQNKVSNVHILSKKDSLHFVAKLMDDEEAVGEVTSLATSKASSRRSRLSLKRKAPEPSDDDDDDEEEEDQTDAAAEEEEEASV